MDIVILAAQILGDRIGSGGDRVFVELARRWSVDHRVTVICPREVRESLEAEIPGSTVITLPAYPGSHSRIALRRTFLIPWVYLMRCLAALGPLRRLRGDVLFLSGDFFCNVIPAVVFRDRFRLRVANIFHINEPPLERRGNPVLNSLISFLLQRLSFHFIRGGAHRILLLNRQVAQRLKGMGFTDERLRVVGAGIDVKAIERIPRSRDRAYDAVYFGRFNPTKGCFDLPSIWKTVVDQVPEARLAVIGSSSESCRKRFMEEITALGVDHAVAFLGFLPYDEAYAILKSSSVFLTPSYEEGWGITICEALVCGLPVVAYRLPVFEEIFPGVLETVPQGDRVAFGRKVIELLRDKPRAHRLARTGKELVSRYDWGSLASQEIALFEDAIQKSKPSGGGEIP